MYYPESWNPFKMIRSIMIKGMEALTAECTLAAVAAGVEGTVRGKLITSRITSYNVCYTKLLRI